MRLNLFDKKLKLLILLAFIFSFVQLSFSQCSEQSYYAFYFTPKYTSEVEDQGRVKFVFVNQSLNSDWELHYEYGLKGFSPDSGEGVEGTLNFTPDDKEISLLVSSGISHDSTYDLYVCGDYIGEFKDAKLQSELIMDFDFQMNRLYYVPFNRQFEDYSLFPDFNISTIHINSLITNGSNTFCNTRMFNEMDHSTQALLLQNKKIKIEFDFKPGEYHGGMSIMPMMKGPSVSQTIDNYYQFIQYPSSLTNTWVHEEIIMDMESESISEGIWFDFRFMDNSGFGSQDFSSFIDNIKISAVGERIEICEGESAIIFGKQIEEEGVYMDTVMGANMEDSIVYTTLIHHPPLFADMLSYNHFRATGAWADYSWYDCETEQLLGVGRDFHPDYSGSFYVKVSDGSCFEESECVAVDLSIGIDEERDFQLKIYPNPASDYLEIGLPKNWTIGQLYITDLSGRLIQTVSLAGDLGSVSIDVEDLSSGIYTLELKDDTAIYYSGKFVKN
jgi:hypothetical protein